MATLKKKGGGGGRRGGEHEGGAWCRAGPGTRGTATVFVRKDVVLDGSIDASILLRHPTVRQVAPDICRRAHALLPRCQCDAAPFLRIYIAEAYLNADDKRGAAQRPLSVCQYVSTGQAGV